MLCRICGTPIKEGERFCSLCGTKTENAGEAQQNKAEQPYGRQSDNRQPHGGQPEGQYFDQPYRQQPGGMYYSAAAKSKKGLWITLSLVAVIAAAAVLMFTVFGYGQEAVAKGTPPKRVLPFKGDTPQTEFANDTAKVLSDAFDIFGNIGIDLNKIQKQPFDMRTDITLKFMGEKSNMKMDMAYDNETLGMNINAEGYAVKMALIEDVLYMDMFGEVTGLDFNSTADLSQPMTLTDRIMVLNEGLNFSQVTVSQNDYKVLINLIMQNMLSKGKYTALAELLLNSIDESCFKSSGSKTTLTLQAGNIADVLRTFAGELEDNEEYKKMYEDYIKVYLGTSGDAVKQLYDTADALEEQKDALDLGLVWEVSYNDGKPVSFEIKANSGDEEYVYSFGYEQEENSTDIDFEIIEGNSSEDVSGACSFKKTGSGTDISGFMITQGEIMNFYGNIAFSGNNTHGTITVNMPDTSYMGIGQKIEMGIDFNLTLDIGMPGTKIIDDGRFKIDTGDATIIDMSSINEMIGLPDIY